MATSEHNSLLVQAIEAVSREFYATHVPAIGRLRFRRLFSHSDRLLPHHLAPGCISKQVRSGEGEAVFTFPRNLVPRVLAIERDALAPNCKPLRRLPHYYGRSKTRRNRGSRVCGILARVSMI